MQHACIRAALRGTEQNSAIIVEADVRRVNELMSGFTPSPTGAYVSVPGAGAESSASRFMELHTVLARCSQCCKFRSGDFGGMIRMSTGDGELMVFRF